MCFWCVSQSEPVISLPSPLFPIHLPPLQDIFPLESSRRRADARSGASQGLLWRAPCRFSRIKAQTTTAHTNALLLTRCLGTLISARHMLETPLNRGYPPLVRCAQNASPKAPSLPKVSCLSLTQSPGSASGHQARGSRTSHNRGVSADVGSWAGAAGSGQAIRLGGVAPTPLLRFSQCRSNGLTRFGWPTARSGEQRLASEADEKLRSCQGR